jgi:electron transfer flavoprotein alpha subunit
MLNTTRRATLRQLSTQLHSSWTVARYLSSLAVLEQQNGKLNSSSQAAVAAAQRLGGSVTAFVAGTGAKSVAQEAAKIKGIEKVIFVENPAYDKVRYVSLVVPLPFELNSNLGRAWPRTFPL